MNNIKTGQYFPIQFGADLVLGIIALLLERQEEPIEFMYQEYETVSSKDFGKRLKIEIPVVKDAQGDVMFGPDDQPVKDLTRPVRICLVDVEKPEDPEPYSGKPLFSPDGGLVN